MHLYFVIIAWKWFFREKSHEEEFSNVHWNKLILTELTIFDFLFWILPARPSLLRNYLLRTSVLWFKYNSRQNQPRIKRKTCGLKTRPWLAGATVCLFLIGFCYLALTINASRNDTVRGSCYRFLLIHFHWQSWSLHSTKKISLIQFRDIWRVFFE